jgi:cytochrome d ubiquinol oxidase subunit II
VPDLTTPAGWLPVVFMVLMGIAILLYVVLDGYDLGVGMLMRGASTADRHTMFASIGPFWDANETWLVLGIGLLLVAFPRAHGMILTALYLPTAAMLVGLILRGVAFDFRYKARDAHQPRWDRPVLDRLCSRSARAGLHARPVHHGFRAHLARRDVRARHRARAAAGYVLLGACWLLIKTRARCSSRPCAGRSARCCSAASAWPPSRPRRRS